MYLKNLSKYELDKDLLSKINGAGYGKVVCNNGESFDAPAQSEDSVEQGGETWCRNRGGVAWSLYIGDLESQ